MTSTGNLSPPVYSGDVKDLDTWRKDATLWWRASGLSEDAKGAQLALSCKGPAAQIVRSMDLDLLQQVEKKNARKVKGLTWNNEKDKWNECPVYK